jgi:hypothetical protein
MRLLIGSMPTYSERLKATMLGAAQPALDKLANEISKLEAEGGGCAQLGGLMTAACPFASSLTSAQQPLTSGLAPVTR